MSSPTVRRPRSRLRVQPAQLAAWRAIATARGLSLAELLDAAVKATEPGFISIAPDTRFNVRTAPPDPRFAPAAAKRFEIRLTDAEREAWQAIADARDLTVADMLRAAVRAYATADEAVALQPPAPAPGEIEALRELLEAR